MNIHTKTFIKEISKIIDNSYDYSNLNQNLNEIRKHYDKIFEEQEKYHKDNNSWWKLQFELISDILTTTHKNATKKELSGDYDKIIISYNNTFYEYPLTKKLILIGRNLQNDLVLGQTDETISRLHCIIVNMHELNKILVIDPGSLNGIFTLKRMASRELINSTPEIRKILDFEFNESFILSMGNAKVCIFPKECIICTEKPRSCLFDCGHYVCCDTCVKKINSCPLCRKNISGINNNIYELKTNILNI